MGRRMSRGKSKGPQFKQIDKRKKVFKSSIEGRIPIKPISVNQCWQGRRFKTKTYKDFEVSCFSLLDKEQYITLKGYLQIYLEFGFSSAACDWDNPIKPFQDILSKMYAFNDRRIMRAVVEKKIVKKGEEYIYFKLFKYTPIAE